MKFNRRCRNDGNSTFGYSNELTSKREQVITLINDDLGHICIHTYMHAPPWLDKLTIYMYYDKSFESIQMF